MENHQLLGDQGLPNGLHSAASGMNNAAVNPTEQLALQLALLQGGLQSDWPIDGGISKDGDISAMLGNVSTAAFRGSLEDLKLPLQRKSQNMTECVPVPTSEHVAEIVGRQGCKIKALRAKTNTYIKTPVRGEEPVFVVTGRKEDVALAKREILSAADHFSQIRASRKSNINSTLAFGQQVANQPGQTTQQVRVPYRVVGLVVGPKGATIKRIQQQTRTYIVTPSRDKEPVFEVTGLPENVKVARKEIEAHIAFRTGSGDGPPNEGPSSGFYGNFNDANGDDNVFTPNSASSGATNEFGFGDLLGNNSATSPISYLHQNNSIFNKCASSTVRGSSGGSLLSTSSFDSATQRHKGGIVLQNILDSNNIDLIASGQGFFQENGVKGWGDSQDSGISSSPPFDKAANGVQSILDHPSGSGIWGELNKSLGVMKISHVQEQHEQQVNSTQQRVNNSSSNHHHHHHQLARASVDLGTLGRPPMISLASSNSMTLIGGVPATASNKTHETIATINTANNRIPRNNGTAGHQPVVPTSSTGSSSVASLSDLSPPNSLPHYLSSNSSGNHLMDDQGETEETNLKKLTMMQNEELMRQNKMNDEKPSNCFE